MRKINIHNPNNLPTIPLGELAEFQEDFKKEMTKTELQKLKNSILNNGLFVPKYVWMKDGVNYILDGHQTKKALCSLIEDGYEVGEIPVVYIEAETKEEASEKLMLINSRYAEINPDMEWLLEQSMDTQRILDEVNIPGIDIDELLSDTPANHMGMETERVNLKPYDKVHILISIPPNAIEKLDSVFDELELITGVEIERGNT